MKCNVCGKRFIPKNEKRYLTADPATPIDYLTGGGSVYDTFDCPRCGCQHRVCVRYAKLGKNKKGTHENEQVV